METANGTTMAKEQADVWGKEWSVDEPYCGAASMLQRVADTPPPPALLMTELSYSLSSFSVATGLGCDAMHPRALLRTHRRWLGALLMFLIRCEAGGAWPQWPGFSGPHLPVDGERAGCGSCITGITPSFLHAGPR